MNTNKHIFLLPKNIKGIDYTQIHTLEKLYDELTYYIENFDTIIIEYKNVIPNKPSKSESSDTLEITRLMPPYNIYCAYSSNDNCLKKAAFQYDSKYYCWFHIHCKKLD